MPVLKRWFPYKETCIILNFLPASHPSLASSSREGAWRFSLQENTLKSKRSLESVFQFWFCGNKIHTCFTPGNVFGKQRRFTRFLIRALALYKVSQVFSVHVPPCIALKKNFVGGEGISQGTSTAIGCVHLETAKNVPLYLTLVTQSLNIFRVFRIYNALSLFMSSNVFILAIKYINSPATKHSIESIPSPCWAVSLEKKIKKKKKKKQKEANPSLSVCH